MNLGTVAICLARSCLCTLHRLPRVLPRSFSLSSVFRERDLHAHDLKARKLARLPGDKCRGEEDSHADIGRPLPVSLSLSLPPESVGSQLLSEPRGSLVTSCARSRVHAYLRARRIEERRTIHVHSLVRRYAHPCMRALVRLGPHPS